MTNPDVRERTCCIQLLHTVAACVGAENSSHCAARIVRIFLLRLLIPQILLPFLPV